MTTTVDDEPTAARLATSLVEDHVAACVQIAGPITSTYRWDDGITTANEWVLVVKTTSDRAGEVVDAIARAHPYDVPEVLVTPVLGGHAPYLEWVASEVPPDL